MRIAAAACLLGLLAAAGCRPTPPVPAASMVEPIGESWRAVARPADRDRLARLNAAWEAGLAAARAGGHGRALAAEGDLLRADAALPRAAPAPGPYRCRLIRLGGGSGRRAYAAFPAHACYVAAEGRLLALTKQTGSERPGGYLWPDGDSRLVFLGGTGSASDPAPPPYGQTEASDLAGIVERVGPFRYRLVVPWPRGGAALDVLELVPALPG